MLARQMQIQRQGSHRTLQTQSSHGHAFPSLRPAAEITRPARVGRQQHQASTCVRVVPEQQEGSAPSAPKVNQEQEVSQASILEKAKTVLETLSKYRRSITVIAAVLDVAFIWVCIKGVRSLGWWQ
mmetsp:Transcript_4659/g.11035  ORF Transcript_4659/g.11035 Transcript_4659/m.11035 type:complete len:126 (-) Transcript_4659:287-664(-)